MSVFLFEVHDRFVGDAGFCLMVFIDYKQFSLILVGLGPIVLDFPYIPGELTDKSN
jgi:deoxyinosine 3'endonuclease (endonuclease V)